jgi:hypothetical protein
MSLTRPLLILIFLSLLAGLLLFLLAAFLMPPGRGGAYAVLALDEALPDREIRALLDDGRVISESSQWVFLDDFTGLRSIPLDEYPARVNPFDPRNDGYGERLRSFFVRGGERFFYIPLGRGPGAAGRLEKRLAASLGDIPYRLEYLGQKKPAALYVFLVLAAGAGALWLSRRFLAAPCIPVLAGFSLAGASGITMAGALLGLGGLLLAPCGEYFMYRRYKKNSLPFGAYENRTLGDILGPFKNRLFLAPLFPAFLVFGSLFGGVHPLLTLGTGIGFMGIYLFSHWVFSRRGEPQDHVRFSPVLILKVPALEPGFSRLVLPYALAALAAIPLSLIFPGPGAASFFPGTPSPVIGEAEYRSHAAFQGSFSLRPLGYTEESGEPVYVRYILGDDGLIAGEAAVFPGADAGGDIPPFPLGDLMAALEPGGNSASGEGTGPDFGEWILVFVVLMISLPALFRPRREDKKGRNRLLCKEKGIAA